MMADPSPICGIIFNTKRLFSLENILNVTSLPDCTPPFIVEIFTDNTEEEEESMSLIRDRGKNIFTVYFLTTIEIK